MKFAVKVVLVVLAALALNVGICSAVAVSIPASVAEIPKPVPIPDAVHRSIFVAPIVCPEGQKADRNGKCRDVW